jgi:hypothetical protein
MGVGSAAAAPEDEFLKQEQLQRQLELERKQVEQQQQLELQRLQLNALEAGNRIQELHLQQQQHVQTLDAQMKNSGTEKTLQLQQHLDMIDESGPLSSSSAGSLRRQQQQQQQQLLPPPPSGATYRSRLQTIAAAGLASLRRVLCRAAGERVQHDVADDPPASGSGS